MADPQKKGRVESGVKYVKNNFLPLREFRDLADANQQLMAWVMQEAGNRGSTTGHHGEALRHVVPDEDRTRRVLVRRAAVQRLQRRLLGVLDAEQRWNRSGLANQENDDSQVEG